MIYRFLDFELDTEQRELRQAGDMVAIPPKPLAVLEYLLEHRDRMVPKGELLDRFWATDVSEAALQTTIRAVRKALGKQAGSAAIKTYHGQGFRFVAPVEDAGADMASDPVTLREQRLVSVLSVRIAELGEETDAVDAFLSEARGRIEADDGRLSHVSLDGFAAVFGLGDHADDSARRAVACAWDLGNLPAARVLPGAVAFGVDTGPVILRDAADEDRWALPGTIERRAASLAQAATSGQILLGAGARAQLEDEVSLRATSNGHLLLSAPAVRAGIRMRPRRALAGFIGREAEMAFLSKRLEAALAGSGQALVLSGPAGIGKSRLVGEFLARPDLAGAQVATAHCLPRLTDTPLAAIRQVCRAIGRDAPPELVRDPVDAALFARMMDGTAPPEPVLEAVSEHAIRQRSGALFARLIATWCSDRPLVLLIEDAHWIDPVSRAHLSAVIDGADDLALMVIVTSRPTDHAPLAQAVLHLSPLGRGESLALLDAFPEIAAIGDGARQALIERAAGNPFFLEELAMAARAGADPANDLPDTVQAVMEVRIAALPPERRYVLYAIAIIGPAAPSTLIAGLLGMDDAAVTAHLGALMQAGFLRDHADGATFWHILLHDTAYAMISPADRRQLHGEVARLLEDAADTVLPETLAWHWQEAGEAARAIEYWTRASNAALYRSAGQAAITFARKGLALIDPQDTANARQELGLQLSLAPGLMTQRGYGAAAVGDAYYRAFALSEQTGSFKARVRALLGLWVHTWVAGRLAESLDHARALLVMAEQADDRALRVQGHASIGSVLMHQGQLQEAQRHLNAGMDLIGTEAPDTITLQNAANTCAAYSGWICALRGETEQVKTRFEQSQWLADAIDNSFARAIHLSLFADVATCGVDLGLGRDLARDAITLSREQGYPFWLGTALVIEGWWLGQAGDFDAGLSAIDEGIAIFEATDAGVQLPNWFGLRAETLLAADRPADSVTDAEKALAHADLTGDQWFAPRIHATLSRAMTRLGDTEGAAQHDALVSRYVSEWGLSPSFAALRDRAV